MKLVRTIAGFVSRLVQPRDAGKKDPDDPRLRQAQQYLRSGQPDKAEQACRQILAAEPRNAGGYEMLGRIALERGRSELAIRHFSAAIAIEPARADLRQGLGQAYHSAGRLPDAIRSLEQAIALDPKDPTARENMGNCYLQEGRLAEAAECYRRAISASPKDLTSYVNLAHVLSQLGQPDAAAKMCRKALRIKADMPEARFGLAMALLQLGEYEEAVAILQKGADSNSDNPDLYHELGLGLSKLGKPDQAIASYRLAIAKRPDFAVAHNSLGVELLARDDLEGALDCFRRALAIKPDFARVHSNLLLTMNYQAGLTQKKLYEKSLQFDQRQARGLLRGAPAHGNARDREKILKVGYVSPDFRDHSVAHFTRQLIGAHNREKVEVYCYAEVARPDAITRQFEAQADHWLSIVGMEDKQVAARIHEDEIDILVDLAGHTSDNRLLVFARKPAPVQVTWLGYPNTTGMRAMDYRLTDAIADPPGAADKLHSEKLVRLAHGFLCYQGGEPEPRVSPPPFLRKGHVTLGTFNTTRKVTPEVVIVWSQILQALPGARLLLKSDSLKDEAAKSALLKVFGDNGIERSRLDLLASIPDTSRHMALYSEIDIGIDPFPYNGTTTTCEALWMGVPVVCLRGDRHAGRVGASVMHHVGLGDLVADSREGYVALVRSLAGDPDRLIALRNSLRPRMQGSPLMDLQSFTDALENAYREMWSGWCRTAQ